MSEWVMIFAFVISSLIGGFVGAILGAFYAGRKYGDLETRVRHAEKRLDDGQPRVRRVDVLEALQDVMRDQMKSWRAETRQQMAELIEEVNRRHEELDAALEDRVTHDECDKERCNA